MRRFLGKIIRKARKIQGVSQNKLIDIIGPHLISLKTLRRIENGNQRVSEESIKVLLDYYDIELSYELRDGYELELMKQFAEAYLEDNEDGADEVLDFAVFKDKINGINREIMLYRALFGSKPELPYESHIYNIVIFAYYLPLINPNDLNDVFVRLGGDFRGRLGYFLDQMENLFISIPDSQLKADAGELAKEMLDFRYNASKEARERYLAFLKEKYQIEHDFNDRFEKYWQFKRKMMGENTFEGSDKDENEQNNG